MAKSKIDRVVKPLKAAMLKVLNKEKKELTELKVVDSDGKLVKIFRKSDFGPRFTFKATQYASNYSTLDNPLTIE